MDIFILQVVEEEEQKIVILVAVLVVMVAEGMLLELDLDKMV